MNNEPRWQQRFEHFQKAYSNFSEVAIGGIEDLSDLEKEGFVQRFEYTFELAWKTLKDYLNENGFDINSPKETIRQAFQNETIVAGEVWMEALKKRNLTSHTYNAEVLNNTVNFLVEAFYPVLEKMHNTLLAEVNS